MSKRTKIFLLLYLFILASFVIGTRLSPDSYYYWEWSHHLALSYYDGPPLIAYVIKLYTLVFGQHEVAICLIGLTSALVSGVLIHKLTRQLFDSRAADMALYIWLLTTGVVNIFFVEVSYNSLVIIFWALVIYFFVQLQQSKQHRYYYLCGIAIGLMMLAKYNGILLILSLLIVCIIDRNYRFILTSVHSYLATLLALAIFSPVIIWNIQNHWVSLGFQLYHGFAMRPTAPLQNIIYYFAINVMKWNFAFAALLYFLAHDYRQLITDSRLRLLFIPTIVVWLFFFLSSMFSIPEVNWNSLFAFTASILVGYFMSKPEIARWVRGLLLAGLTSITLLMLILMRFALHLPPALYLWGYSWGVYELVQQLPSDIRHSPLPVFVSGDYRLPAYLSTFLPNKRQQVFGLSPTTHQYYYWWLQSRDKINASEGLYYSRVPVSHFPAPLKACHLAAWRRYYHKRDSERYVWQLYVYRCSL